MSDWSQQIPEYLSRQLGDFFKSLREIAPSDRDLLIFIARKYLELRCRQMGEIFKMDPSTAWRIAERVADRKSERTLMKKG